MAKVQASRNRSRTVLALALACLVVVIAISLAMMVRSWEQQIAKLPDIKDRITEENETLRTLLQLSGGAIVLIGFYFTWRTIRVSQEGQITDRFNKAIDHLGATSVTVRLGGIHALARIAQDSAKDAPTVVEIFSSYLRDATSSSVTPLSFDVVPSDVKALLNILGTAAWARNASKDLRGCKFTGLIADRLDLSHSILDDTVFLDCRMAEARFDESSLRAANFSNAYLRNSSFRKCDATVANFSNAMLRAANFSGAAVFGAEFTEANLLGADFTGATNAIHQQFEQAICDETTTLPTFDKVAPHEAG